NPVSLTNKPKEHGARTRVLSADELREIWLALEGAGQYADIVRLLAFTAARRTEIGDLSWDELDIGAAEIRLPATRPRGGRPHPTPLAADPRAILGPGPAGADRGFIFGRGETGFVGWSSAKRALDERIATARKAAGMTEPMLDWTLHDLRRTASTVM